MSSSSLSSYSILPLALREKYIQGRELNSGADGIVHVYYHKLNPECRIAVKTPNLTNYETAKLVRALAHEVERLRALQGHDNIVRLFGWDDNVDCGPAIYLEFADLGDVWEYGRVLRKGFGHVPEQSIWKMFADMSKAIEFLHRQHLIHGDIKPDNILAFRSETSKLRAWASAGRSWCS